MLKSIDFKSIYIIQQYFERNIVFHLNYFKLIFIIDSFWKFLTFRFLFRLIYFNQFKFKQIYFIYFIYSYN